MHSVEITPVPQEAEADLATVAFVNSTIEIMAMTNGELRQHLPEFGFALRALITRVASLGEFGERAQ